MAVQSRDVHKAFGGTPVLCGVDLVIPAGAISVILGPSGTGKSVSQFLTGISPAEDRLVAALKRTGALSELFSNKQYNAYPPPHNLTDRAVDARGSLAILRYFVRTVSSRRYEIIERHHWPGGAVQRRILHGKVGEETIRAPACITFEFRERKVAAINE